MGSVAYALRDEFDGTVELDGETVPKFSGGLIRTGQDAELELGAALAEGDGVIVVDDRDQAAIVALDGVAALKRVGVPEGAEPVSGDYQSQSNQALRAELNRRGVTGGGNKSHDELVTALDNYDRLNDAGELGEHELTVKALAEADVPEGGE